MLEQIGEMATSVGTTVSSVDVNSMGAWAQANQGMIGVFGWVILAIYAVARLARSKFGGEFDWGRAGNTLQAALATNGWRWGKEDGQPSGKSIVLERADGSKLVANFKTNKFFLYTKKVTTDSTGKSKVSFKEKDLSEYLTRKQVKKLRILRDKVVANLKATDAANAKADKARKDEEVLAALNTFGRRV